MNVWGAVAAGAKSQIFLILRNHQGLDNLVISNFGLTCKTGQAAARHAGYLIGDLVTLHFKHFLD